MNIHDSSGGYTTGKDIFNHCAWHLWSNRGFIMSRRWFYSNHIFQAILGTGPWGHCDCVLLQIPSSCASWAPSPLLPTLVLSPVLQLGRTAELRGTQELREPISPRWQAPASGGPQLFLRHIQETFGNAKEQWVLCWTAGHNLPPSFPVCSSHSLVSPVSLDLVFTVTDISLQKLRSYKINLPIKTQ